MGHNPRFPFWRRKGEVVWAQFLRTTRKPSFSLLIDFSALPFWVCRDDAPRGVIARRSFPQKEKKGPVLERVAPKSSKPFFPVKEAPLEMPPPLFPREIDVLLHYYLLPFLKEMSSPLQKEAQYRPLSSGQSLLTSSFPPTTTFFLRPPIPSLILP